MSTIYQLSITFINKEFKDMDECFCIDNVWYDRCMLEYYFKYCDYGGKLDLKDWYFVRKENIKFEDTINFHTRNKVYFDNEILEAFKEWTMADLDHRRVRKKVKDEIKSNCNRYICYYNERYKDKDKINNEQGLILLGINNSI